MKTQPVPRFFFSKLVRPRPVSLGILACALVLPVSLSQAVEGMTAPGGISAPGQLLGEVVADRKKMLTQCSGGVEIEFYQTTYSGGLSPADPETDMQRTDRKCGPENEQKTEQLKPKPKPKPTEAAKGGVTATGLGIGAAIVGGVLVITNQDDNKGTTGTTGTTGTR
jgi:hypothetical protein